MRRLLRSSFGCSAGSEDPAYGKDPAYGCRRLVGVSALLVMMACGDRANAPATPAADGSEIRASAIEAHMRFLASDLLEGREAGTRGYDLAAAYVASQFNLT